MLEIKYRDSTINPKENWNPEPYISKFIPFKKDDNTINIVTKKFSKDEGYLYSSTSIPQNEYDEIDIDFKNTYKKKWIKKVIYGLHSYGGYWRFFRPDIYEVASLTYYKIPESDLENIDRIYITTKPISYNIDEVYDRKKDKHRAKTIMYILYKKE